MLGWYADQRNLYSVFVALIVPIFTGCVLWVRGYPIIAFIAAVGGVMVGWGLVVSYYEAHNKPIESMQRVKERIC